MNALVNLRIIFALALFLTLASIGCAPKVEQATESTTTYQNLYFASGACYSGNGITTFTNSSASNVVAKVSLSGASENTIIADYSANGTTIGDSPVGLAFNSAKQLLVGVENTTTASARKIEIVDPNQTNASASRSIYTSNITALSAQIRKMVLLPDNYLLVSKSTAIEKMDNANRLLAGTFAWVTPTNPPATSSCGPSVTLISDVLALPSGLIVFSHAAAANARVGVIGASGFNVVGDCKGAVTPPNAASFPTAMVYDKTNLKLIVAYMGSTTATDISTIITYSVNETTGALTNPQKIYDANLFGSTYNFLLFGVSAMTYDETNKKLYVATSNTTATNIATSGNYQIMKLNYDASLIGVTNTSVLTRDSIFVPPSRDTKCISSMLIAD